MVILHTHTHHRQSVIPSKALAGAATPRFGRVDRLALQAQELRTGAHSEGLQATSGKLLASHHRILLRCAADRGAAQL